MHFNKGPSSSQKKRRGGKFRGNKTTNISDFDTKSCYFGTVERIVNGHNILVKDLNTNNIVHTTTHRTNSKKFNKGSPVVFSYTKGEKTGEILCMYNADDLTDLCQHFKISFDKASKAMGMGIGLSNDSIDYDSVPVIKQTIEPINVPTQQIYSMMDLIQDDDINSDLESEFEEDIEVKCDRFGNTIENKTVDIIVEQVDERNPNSINIVAEQDIESLDEESQPLASTDKFSKNKKSMKTARGNARKNKQSFFEY
jgi:hypothetical protein